ncbi:MAG: HupE/UreJ family protein [Pseudomonadales bacterium]
MQGRLEWSVVVLALVAWSLLWPLTAAAHAGHDAGSGFLSGLAHPVLGADHLVAMVAVGLWGAILRAPALWLLPVVFPMVMAIGGALGVLGVPLGFVEPVIALSAVALGLLVAFAVGMPLTVAMILVGVFALFHGHAHGTELPEAANPFAYALGFVIATGLLHLCGVALGMLLRWPAGSWVVRGSGAAIAVVGLAFLTA